MQIFEDRGVLGRGLAVLEGLNQAKRITDIARYSGLPKSTIHRVLHELRSQGWVVQNADDSYSRGWRWASITGQIGTPDEITGEIESRLARFRDQTDCSMGFSLFRGATLVCDMRVPGAHGELVKPDVGAAVSLTSSATGRSLLAALPESQMLRMVSAALPDGGIEEIGATVSKVRRGRALGFSIKRREAGPDQSMVVACYSMVILDRQRRPVAAMSAAQVNDPFDFDQMSAFARYLRSSANDIATLFAA